MSVSALSAAHPGLSDHMAPKIIDATLREGCQAPGVCFGLNETVEIAKALCDLEVDMVECGHPLIGKDEVERVQAVVAVCDKVPVLSHARARVEDIDAVRATGATWVGIFLRLSEIPAGRRPASGDAHRLIATAVRHARRVGLHVRFTAEDSSRTEESTLMLAYEAAVEAGADRLCFADTVGLLNPWQVAEHIARLKERFPELDIEGHFHDDRGLADANALGAARAGATWISTSVNGLGERCGVTDTITTLVNLHAESLRPLPNGDALQRASNLVRAHARAQPDYRRPVVGRNAFTHTAKLHRQAAGRDPRAYAWLDPRLLGREQNTHFEGLPAPPRRLVSAPLRIPATELPYHRKGPGIRYVMVDNRLVHDARQYCIVRRIPLLSDYGSGHVDLHRHTVDSLFLFLGDGDDYTGLTVELRLGGDTLLVKSPASVLIPSGMWHSYRVVEGAGTYVNHVLAGTYHSSLLDDARAHDDRAEDAGTALLRGFLTERKLDFDPNGETPVADVFDSLMMIDFFVHVEASLGDCISLDDVARCSTFRQLTQLLNTASRAIPGRR